MLPFLMLSSLASFLSTQVFSSTCSQWSIFPEFFIEFVDDALYHFLFHVKYLQIINVPYNQTLFSIYDFVCDTFIIVIEFESHSISESNNSLQNSSAACRVPYNAFLRFTHSKVFLVYFSL